MVVSCRYLLASKIYMQISDKYPQFLAETAIVAVVGKEHGVIYRIKDGMMEQLSELENKPPHLSDDEGFFFRAAHGHSLGSGAPKELNEDEYLRRFEKAISAELDELIRQEQPQVLYIFEPEYVKGKIVEHMQKHPQLVIHNVRHGNYVQEHPETLLEHIHEFIEEHKIHTNRPEDFDRDLKESS